jgi:hypothetical protein
MSDDAVADRISAIGSEFRYVAHHAGARPGRDPVRLRLAATSTASVADTPAASIKRVAGPTERPSRSISTPEPTAGITTCQSRRYIVRGMEAAWHEVGAQSAIVDSAIAGERPREAGLSREGSNRA